MNSITRLFASIVLISLCGTLFAQSSDEEKKDYNYTSEQDLIEWSQSVLKSRNSFYDEWSLWTGTVGDKIVVDTQNKIIFLSYWDHYPKDKGQFIDAKKLYKGNDKSKQAAVVQFVKEIENHFNGLSHEMSVKHCPKSVLFAIGCRYLLKVRFCSSDEQMSMTIDFKPNNTYKIFNVNPSDLESPIVKKYREEAEKGDAESQLILAQFYELGSKGLKQDLEESLKWLRKSADQGNVKAQWFLGVKYEYGRGVPIDYSEAVMWYRKSAEQGDAAGQCDLGQMYENGYGVSQDYSEAVKWYRKSAEQGFARGQYHLGKMYQNGKGVTKDFDKAVMWYRKSAEQGYAVGQCALGLMYDEGMGVKKDLEQAKYWYEKAAEQGNETAKELLNCLPK